MRKKTSPFVWWVVFHLHITNVSLLNEIHKSILLLHSQKLPCLQAGWRLGERSSACAERAGSCPAPRLSALSSSHRTKLLWAWGKCTGSPAKNTLWLGKAGFIQKWILLTTHTSDPHVLLEPFFLEQNRKQLNPPENPNPSQERKEAVKTHSCLFALILTSQQFIFNNCYHTFCKRVFRISWLH